jgi:hypothetical protein
VILSCTLHTTEEQTLWALCGPPCCYRSYSTENRVNIRFIHPPEGIPIPKVLMVFKAEISQIYVHLYQRLQDCIHITNTENFFWDIHWIVYGCLIHTWKTFNCFLGYQGTNFKTKFFLLEVNTSHLTPVSLHRPY